MMNWQGVLQSVAEDRATLSRLMNSISLMEYMGARKIIKSQLEKDICAEVLAHMSEEIRHAQVFKKMALKLSDGVLDTYEDEHLLAGAQARAYIQTVDQAIYEALPEKDSHLNYLLSTLLIEERANSVYPYFSRVVAAYGFSTHIDKILREEEHHLQEIEERLMGRGEIGENKLNQLRHIETQAFFNLIEAIAREQSMPNSAGAVTSAQPF